MKIYGMWVRPGGKLYLIHKSQGLCCCNAITNLTVSFLATKMKREAQWRCTEKNVYLVLTEAECSLTLSFL